MLCAQASQHTEDLFSADAVLALSGAGHFDCSLGLPAGLPYLDSRRGGQLTAKVPRRESLSPCLLSTQSTGHHYVLEETRISCVQQTDTPRLPLPSFGCPPTTEMGAMMGWGGIHSRSTAAREATQTALR